MATLDERAAALAASWNISYKEARELEAEWEHDPALTGKSREAGFLGFLTGPAQTIKEQKRPRDFIAWLSK